MWFLPHLCLWHVDMYTQTYIQKRKRSECVCVCVRRTHVCVCVWNKPRSDSWAGLLTGCVCFVVCTSSLSPSLPVWSFPSDISFLMISDRANLGHFPGRGRMGLAGACGMGGLTPDLRASWELLRKMAYWLGFSMSEGEGLGTLVGTWPAPHPPFHPNLGPSWPP